MPGVTPRGRATVVVAALSLAALPSCGGSGPTAPPRPPPGPTPGVRFTPLTLNPPDDSLTLAARSSDTETITLALTANSVEDLFGYGVDLVFDPEVLALDSFAGAGMFQGEGNQVSIQVVENPPGRLVIGQTRVGAVSGFSGSADLLLFTFRALAAGSSGMLLESGQAFDSSGADNATVFLGGNVTVTR